MSQEKIERILAGDVRLAGRLMRDIDDERPSARALVDALYPHTGGAHFIGVTGSPGVGKSTLVNQLIAALRARGERVGVVAVDPSSPFSGGAILGDRIRMAQHATDPGVFIRSVATRGALGGLSISTMAIARVLDAMGFGTILIETVGVGQAEVDIARNTHTSVVVSAPGLGDNIQAAKAGLLEIAQVLVVNKRDLPGAKRAAHFLSQMVADAAPSDWPPPVVLTDATAGEGIDALVDALKAHAQHLKESGRWQAKQEEWTRAEALRLVGEATKASAARLHDQRFGAEEDKTTPHQRAELILEELQAIASK